MTGHGFKRQSILPAGDVEVVQPDHAELNADVRTAGDTLAQTPTITAGLYAAGDNVGGLLTFANAARDTGGGGVIKDVSIVDDAGQDAALELWLFDQTFTAGVDNAVWTPLEADLENIVAIISTADGTYFAAGAGQSVCHIETASRYDLLGTSLFGRLVNRGAPTYTQTDDLSVKIGLLMD